jgi:hypothetical protein
MEVSDFKNPNTLVKRQRGRNRKHAKQSKHTKAGERAQFDQW